MTRHMTRRVTADYRTHKTVRFSVITQVRAAVLPYRRLSPRMPAGKAASVGNGSIPPVGRLGETGTIELTRLLKALGEPVRPRRISMIGGSTDGEACVRPLGSPPAHPAGHQSPSPRLPRGRAHSGGAASHLDVLPARV